MQVPCLPYAFPTGVDDGDAADAFDDGAFDAGASDAGAFAEELEDEVPVAAVCPSVPSTSVTPVAVVESTAVAPGTAFATALAWASEPFGYSTTVVVVVVVSDGAPTTKPFAVSAAEAAVAPPGVDPPFCTDTCTLAGAAAVADVYAAGGPTMPWMNAGIAAESTATVE